MNMIMENDHGAPRAPRGNTNQEKGDMAFVNEYISEADIEKYGIKELDEKFGKGHYKPHWTLDRERDIYLRYLHNEREEHSNRLTFYFYWKGTPLVATFDLDGGGVRDGEQWRSFSLRRMEIPETIKQQKAEMIADLKEALTAERAGGVYSTATKFTATFDF